tara:strand:- start:73 stop:267 length:195 start_codon:yes stop_codon:yes gene_type:complete
VKIAFVFHRIGSGKIFNEFFNNSCQFFLEARPFDAASTGGSTGDVPDEGADCCYLLTPPAPRLR